MCVYVYERKGLFAVDYNNSIILRRQKELLKSSTMTQFSIMLLLNFCPDITCWCGVFLFVYFCFLMMLVTVKVD